MSLVETLAVNLLGPEMSKQAHGSRSKTQHDPYIIRDLKKYPVDVECRVGVEYLCNSYEPKVYKAGLPEVLLHYIWTLAKERTEDNAYIPRRIQSYREGSEFSCQNQQQENLCDVSSSPNVSSHEKSRKRKRSDDTKEKEPESIIEDKKNSLDTKLVQRKKVDEYGDLISIIGPGIYVICHNQRKILVQITTEGYTYLKETFFIQFHWFRGESADHHYEQYLLDLVNDAKRFFPFDTTSFTDADDRMLTVYGYNAKAGCWEQTKRIPQRSLSSMHIPNQIKKDLLTKIDKFLKEQDRQKMKELPRKFAILISSDRGGGKKNLINALLGHFHLHKGVLPVDDIDNDLLCVSGIPNQTAIVIEKIENVEDEGSLINLQTLLDGRETDRPLLIFVTYTKKETLSESSKKILKTCQRFDLEIELKAPQKEEIQAMFERFFPEQKKQFPSFMKRLKKMDLPNLYLLESFFAKHLDCTDFSQLSETAYHQLEISIKKHKENISFINKSNSIM